jgi:Zn finger protein HypA/HybF involved in hydrogenase expression
LNASRNPLCMHELSMALEVCRLAEDLAAPDPADRIVEVGIEVGEESGYEVANFEFCLEALLSSPPFGNAKPVIQRVAGDGLRLCYLEVDDGSTADRGS